MNKTERSRLSIDLDAYPDIRDMLNDAIAATGDSATKLTIAALRARLPDVVMDLQHRRTAATKEFAKKYVDASSASIDEAARRLLKHGAASVEAALPNPRASKPARQLGGNQGGRQLPPSSDR